MRQHGQGSRGTSHDDRKDFPVEMSVGGMSIGAARSVEHVLEHEHDPVPATVFRFAGLDSIARVFFAERVGPGGPEDTPLQDVRVMDHRRHRTLLASEVLVRHFSAGTGELELTGLFQPPEASAPYGRG